MPSRDLPIHHWIAFSYGFAPFGILVVSLTGPTGLSLNADLGLVFAALGWACLSVPAVLYGGAVSIVGWRHREPGWVLSVAGMTLGMIASSAF